MSGLKPGPISEAKAAAMSIRQTRPRAGFQPLRCGCIRTQGFALGWYRNAPLALEAIRRAWIANCGFWGGVTNFGFFSQTDSLPVFSGKISFLSTLDRFRGCDRSLFQLLFFCRAVVMILPMGGLDATPLIPCGLLHFPHR
jgi:hypothetical protein